MKSALRLCAIGAAMIVSTQLTGCAQLALGTPAPTMETTVKLRNPGLGQVAVGSFTLDPSKPASLDQGAGLRGANTLKSPYEGSFAKYLGETLKVELQSAGLLNAASGTVISGTLTRSDVDPAMGTGTGALGARFVVTRDGAVKFDRELQVTDSWESSFMGAVAIPKAAAQYEGLYRKLVAKLVDDAAFRTAIAKQ